MACYLFVSVRLEQHLEQLKGGLRDHQQAADHPHQKEDNEQPCKEK